METQLPASLEALILAQIRATRASLRTGGIAGAVVMLIIAAVTYFGLSGNDQGLWVLGAGLAPLGILFVIPSLLDPTKAKPLRLLRTRPGDVVWLYVRRITGSHNATLIMCGLNDGKFFGVPCEVGQEEHVLGALAAFLPHATTGFSPALEAKFRATPQALRRS